MAWRVFIDGQEGTTGLKIFERFAARKDVTLLTLDAQHRKDAQARRDMLHTADVAFLCLPDDAARESVALAQGSRALLIDTSTAHRVAAGWAYGLPELSENHLRAVQNVGRIAVPGCHATGFIIAAYPLRALGFLGRDARMSCYSVTGYSGGGKKMIAQYEAVDRPAALQSPRQYALSLAHKHLPEMQRIPDFAQAPLFNPLVCDFYAGMAVSVPVFAAQMQKRVTRSQLRDALRDYYAGQRFVHVADAPEDGFLPATLHTGTNELTLFVCGNDEQFTLVSVFDNLGKGASGAAMQCMDLALHIQEGNE